MGGGGGGGQQNNSVGSAGSNGGGIIIIKASTLTTSCTGSITISANGANAANSGNDGSGGAGAGGSILLSVNTFSVPASCPLTVQGNGGNGGNVTDPNSHGGGGGGGQGVVIYPSAVPSTNITTVTTSGTGGTNNSSGSSSAAGGTGTSGSGILPNSGFGTLPIKLTDFTAQLKEGTVDLAWHSVMEKNFDHFEVERAAGNTNFNSIGEVRGDANSEVTESYAFADAAPSPGVNYYRLKSVDLDGNAAYSAVVTVDVAPRQAGFTVFPNPISTSFTVSLQGHTGETYSISLIDLSGNPVFTTEAQVQNGLIAINLTRKPASGVYLVSVRSAETRMVAKVLVK
jgi:hypothetical protein